MMTIVVYAQNSDLYFFFLFTGIEGSIPLYFCVPINVRSIKAVLGPSNAKEFGIKMWLKAILKNKSFAKDCFKKCDISVLIK